MTQPATPTLDPDFERKAVNTIRMLSADGVQAANSGHPGMPMGMAQAAFTLWTGFLRHNPANPDWNNRDRFVLSAGHGSMLLYSLLHLTGYDLPLDELRNFRQWGSKTPGHPEHGHTPGVETTTGPLGQGFANGVGMAMAERWLAARFNRPGFDVVDHYVYAIVGDGDLMEGISSEAASLAGHLKLGKLIYLYDDNHISIEGSTDLAFTEDWAKRFDAYGWHVQEVDALDPTALEAAITAAKADPRPSIIGCKSIIGYGSPNKPTPPTSTANLWALTNSGLTKENLDWPEEPRFFVPDDVRDFFRTALDRGAQQETDYNRLFEAYSQAHPELAAESTLAGELPENWQMLCRSSSPRARLSPPATAAEPPSTPWPRPSPTCWAAAPTSPAATRPTSRAPAVRGGRTTSPVATLHFGVREHAMAASLNGMALHGGVIPFGGTFLVFADYMRPPMRLAALMGLGCIYVLTHDSIFVGEDGPTHQPVEHLAALRVIPNMTVIRPADANETAMSWRAAIENTTGPTVLALTRQNLPTFDRSAAGMGSADGVLKGGYTLFDSAPGQTPDVILMGSGSEVSIAMDGAAALAEEGVAVRVVSLASWELFAKQDAAYRAEVLPAGVPKVAIEAASPFGWERWVGNDPAKGAIIAIDHFGASAPFDRVYKEFGLTPEAVVAAAKRLLGVD